MFSKSSVLWNILGNICAIISQGGMGTPVNVNVVKVHYNQNTFTISEFLNFTVELGYYEHWYIEYNRYVEVISKS